MKIVNATGPLPTTGTLVAFVGGDGTLSEAAQALDAAADGLVRRALELPGKNEHGRLIDLALPQGLRLDRLVLAFCGRKDGMSRLDLEEQGAAIARHLDAAKVREAHVAPLDGIELPLAPGDAATALAAGAALRSYGFRRYKTDPEGAPTLETLTFVTQEPVDELLATASAVTDAVRATRDLVSEPANVLTPERFARSCEELTGLGVDVEVLDPAKLEAIGMRALLAVGQGSANPPFVVVMRWRGIGAKQPLALVGKGVCFDSGGISIKPSGGMEDMKWDMAGAAAVVGAMRALAGRKAACDVVGVIGLAENMPSGTAQRPGDVVTTLAGKTVEVINTDAEGRLILADVLWYTQDRFKPSTMIDLATLTGAVIVALGHEQAGMFASDETLAQQLARAGEATGELLWRLPMSKAYAKHVRSEIADLKNVGRGREAGSIAGAMFLQPFTNEVPWAHLDIAGVAWTSRDLPLAGKGATGFGVRLLDRFIAENIEGSQPVES